MQATISTKDIEAAGAEDAEDGKDVVVDEDVAKGNLGDEDVEAGGLRGLVVVTVEPIHGAGGLAEDR